MPLRIYKNKEEALVARKQQQKDWRNKNKDHLALYRVKWREEDRRRVREWYAANKDRTEYQLYVAAKNRARKRGIDFTITLDDITIPAVCPILGTEFVKYTKYAASLDRVDNSKGYVKGNIAVISRKANSLKADATIEQLKRTLEWMESFL